MNSRLLTTDRLESPLFTLGSSDHASRTYGPYGYFRISPDAAALGFTGQRFEASMGGYLLGSYRLYNPIMMRFHSADSWSPFGEGGGNAYAYCAGDPISRRDPSGHVITTFAQVGRISGLVNNAFSIGWVGLGTPPKDNIGVNVNRAILGGGDWSGRCGGYFSRCSGSSHCDDSGNCGLPCRQCDQGKPGCIR